MRTPKRSTPYEGHDTALFIHHNKTHRTMSEAFKDADYATPIWRCETEWDRVKDGAIWVVLWIALIGSLYGLSFIGR
jgi:hypothetical protein